MSKVFIEESTLTAIGDAIRSKTDKTDLIAPGDMATEIEGITTGVEIEPVVLSGNCTYACRGALAAKYIELFGDTVSTNNITDAGYMFQDSPLSIIPFELNFSSSASYCSMVSLFSGSTITECPPMNNAAPHGIGSLFNNCKYLRTLPDDLGNNWNWNKLYSNNYGEASNIFNYCYSLRKVPSSFISKCYSANTGSYYSQYNNQFAYCYALDEINGLVVCPTTLTSNCFSNTFMTCYRLKNMTFEMNDDGTPKTANWTAQTIDLTGAGVCPGLSTYVTGYNSGITADKAISDDATYQALKDDPDWFSMSAKYSRYNHDSAVTTINSLPDTSAYGTNTIKFKGSYGSATDGGAINTLTEEEIAVATAKGWTVSLV